MIIHYHRQSGRIGAWGNADCEESYLPDHAVLRIDSEIPLDPRRQRIEHGEVMEIPERDLTMWNCPTVDELAARIEMELQNTDQFMMPDRDVRREPWITYRRALRDLSKLPDAMAQVQAWPTRPDGKDSRP